MLFSILARRNFYKTKFYIDNYSSYCYFIFMQKNNTHLWDLSVLYKEPNDPQIDKDLDAAINLITNFKNFKGKLDTKLNEAISEYIKIDQILHKLIAYFQLQIHTHANDEKLKQKYSIINEKISKATAENMVFFDIEIGDLDEKLYTSQIEAHSILQEHKPMLDHIRKLKEYQLSESVEEALAKRSPFITEEWGDLLDEMDATLKYDYDGKKYSFMEILNIINENPDDNKRFEALKVFNNTLNNSGYAKLRARALNVVLGVKAVNDNDRGFKKPISARNLSNKIDDETVKALHETVLKEGTKYSKKYYKLLAKILKKDKLLWSDRNAPLPFRTETKIKWEDAIFIVKEAYQSFSPTLRDLIENKIEKQNLIDVPIYEGKTGGAFNYSLVIPDNNNPKGKPVTFTFLNYLGTNNDVMTLAHELGHGVHGLLAGEEQGVLQFHPPMAYAETASIFGENITFNYLYSKLNDDKEKLVLLMEKINGFINSVIRQISFSNFELRIHQQRREKGKLTIEDFNSIWMSVTKEMYGEDGEIFTYKNMDYLWAYVSHFMRPFYVYSYAFGELFTHSLYSIKDKYSNFEEKYLNLLKAGGTKTAKELMAPFELNPSDKNFWINGMEVSIKKWLDEAEVIINKIML